MDDLSDTESSADESKEARRGELEIIPGLRKQLIAIRGSPEYGARVASFSTMGMFGTPMEPWFNSTRLKSLLRFPETKQYINNVEDSHNPKFTKVGTYRGKSITLISKHGVLYVIDKSRTIFTFNLMKFIKALFFDAYGIQNFITREDLKIALTELNVKGETIINEPKEVPLTTVKQLKYDVWTKRNGDHIYGRCFCCGAEIGILEMKLHATKQRGKKTVENTEPACDTCSSLYFSHEAIDIDDFKSDDKSQSEISDPSDQSDSSDSSSSDSDDVKTDAKKTQPKRTSRLGGRRAPRYAKT